MGTGSSGLRGLVRRARPLALAIPLLLTALVGCSLFREPAPPPKVAEKVWLNGGPGDECHSDAADVVSGLALAMRGAAPDRPADKPINVVCVSGGGKYAAFTAGALCGWTASGMRPVFDVATGVSSGAPTALMAFLGSKYDFQLSDIFLTLDRSDLYVWRPVRGIVAGNGLMSARPLKKMLDERINAEVIADLRTAHAEGRRLYIATTNVRTHKLVAWDVGAIASSGRPDAVELVRKIILAACSIPGLVPPVDFEVTVNGVCYTEQHADAGNLAQVFLRLPGPLPPGSSIWVLSAGKTYPNPATSQPRILGSMGAAISSTLYSLFRADALRLYALCGVTRSRFCMLAVPTDFVGKANSMAFDHDELRRLYMVGYQMAAGDAWETLPPDSKPGELAPPRSGTDFVTQEMAR